METAIQMQTNNLLTIDKSAYFDVEKKQLHYETELNTSSAYFIQQPGIRTIKRMSRGFKEYTEGCIHSPFILGHVFKINPAFKPETNAP